MFSMPPIEDVSELADSPKREDCFTDLSHMEKLSQVVRSLQIDVFCRRDSP